MMHVAVVGAGFCGLAVAYYFAKKGDKVTLFDKTGVGAGASGITVGLLHPFAGPQAKVSFRGLEGLEATYRLFEEVGYQPKYGILRPQIAGMDFSQAKNYPDVEWWEAELAQEKLQQLAPLPCLFIRSGAVVDCKKYLEALFKGCQKHGVTFLQQEVVTASPTFDATIFTVGADLGLLPDIDHPSIEKIRGQTIEFEWPYKQSLPFAINAGVQFAQISPDSVWAGATYERKLLTESQAEEEIRKKIAYFAPPFANLTVKSRKTAYRAATGNKRPFIYFTAPNTYVLGGMGSKGLLYHALYAQELLDDVYRHASQRPY